MDLINWSLNAIDTLFSTRSLGLGEPECLGGTFDTGYTMDGWGNCWIVCLAGLSIEDIEDIYLFGTMITGLLLIGAGLALAYRKLEKVATAVQTPTRLAAVIDTMGRAVSTQSVLIDRNTDNIIENLTSLVSTHTMLIERSMDEILEKLTTLQREIEKPGDH